MENPASIAYNDYIRNRGGSILNTTAKNVFLWIVIVVAVVVLWNFLNSFKSANVEEITYSEFNQLVQNDSLRSARTNPIVITGNQMEGTFEESGNDRKFEVLIPSGAEQDIANLLIEKGMAVEIRKDDQGGWIYMLLTSWFPIILFVAFWIFLMRQMQSGGNKALSFGKSRATALDQPAEEGHF